MCFTHTFWPQDQLPDYRGSLLGLVGLPTRGLALQFRLLVSFSVFSFTYVTLSYTSVWDGPLFFKREGDGQFSNQRKPSPFCYYILIFLCKIILAQAMRINDNPIIIAMNDRTPEYLKGVFKPSSADYIENKITMPKRRAVL